MAAELHPPEPMSTATATATATTTTTTTATSTEPTTTATATTTALAQSENPGPLPPAPKRQRRPSVRLGEIGDHHHHHHHHHQSYDSHIRRTKQQQQQHTWRTPKDSSKLIKARSLTNLVNGNNNEIEEHEVNNNQNGELNLVEFGHRKKGKRATVKRVRSNWVSSNSRIVDEGGDNNLENSNGEEGYYREFDLDSDSQLKDQSPVHSVDNVALDTWRTGRRTGSGRVRAMDRESEEMENNNNNLEEMERKWEGVKTWLTELGLSRYAPVFEIHEVDDEVLPLLTLEDLKDMGINAVGSRRKLYSAIQKLRKGFS